MTEEQFIPEFGKEIRELRKWPKENPGLNFQTGQTMAIEMLIRRVYRVAWSKGLRDAEELAEMKKQYPYATLEHHMMFNGEVRRRCGICLREPVREGAYHVMWCETCLSEYEASPEPRDLDGFVDRKKRIARNG